MQKNLVYDLPLRLFHLVFAFLFLTAFGIGKIFDHESSVFAYHMLAGMTLSFVIVLRIFWGFLGTRHARFTNFALSPNSLINYFLTIISGEKKRWSGHNPASSWAALIMMLMGLGLGVSGYLMISSGGGEFFEEVHEIFGSVFAIVVLLHISGIVLHTVRHRENIALSMINGKKQNVVSTEAIINTRPLVAVAFIFLVVIFGTNLLINFDSQNGTLKIFGTSLQLNESAESRGDEHHHEHDNDGESEHKAHDD